ncbi:oxidoreductase [Isoptericola sp. F-RaC21]|uniref:oxidoreductase n=1 Tax=Isoptericola sp. F-RaC21 TaxID=3141452 RepID=UPI00315BF23D
MTTTTPTHPGGTWTLGDRAVPRVGYGAMQLAGPGVMGPPRDPDEAVAVLREAVALGVTHLDTSAAYGPQVTNRLIREALHPYPDQLLVATKVGARRDAAGGWPTARRPEELRAQVLENLESLGVDALDLVYLRMGDATGPHEGSLAEAFETLAGLRQQGLVRHLGVSNVTAGQVAEARAIAPVVAVQNMFHLAHRGDDDLVDRLADDGIAFVPFFPLGGFTPLQSETLSKVAAAAGTTPTAVALAWLLHRSPNVLVIPGTSSRAHLRENVAAAGLHLSAEQLADLDAIGRRSTLPPGRA